MDSVVLRELYRHPIKSVGAEALDAVTLMPGKPMPWDRAWAIGHGNCGFDPDAPGWRRCSEFVRQTHVPELARMAIRLDEATGHIALSHPRRPDLTVDPDRDASALTEWLAPLADAGRPGPYRLCRLPDGAFTDADAPWLSVGSLSSKARLERRAGKPLGHIRFRMNLWVDGLDPWAEAALVGRTLAIGDVRLRVTEPIARCLATHASPETGTRDVEVLSMLEAETGTQDFGVCVAVLNGGTIRQGDPVRLV